MERRKFLVGMGSLAAAGAATMGTGALSQTTMRRKITGQVSKDSAGYVHLDTKHHVKNGNHATTTSNGQLKLDFGKVGGNGSYGQGGNGLNADSKNWFDEVFDIELSDLDKNSSGSDYKFKILRDVNQHTNDLRFYKDGSRNKNGYGTALWCDDGPGGQWTDFNNTNKPSVKTWFQKVGVMIDISGWNPSTGTPIANYFGSDPGFKVRIKKT